MADEKAAPLAAETLQAVIGKDIDHVWHPMAQHKLFAARPPGVFVKAEGCTVTDAGGKEYLDAFAGLWCVNVGWGREEIARAVYEQMVALPYYPHTQAHVPGAEFADKLAEKTNPELGHVYFVNSGSEANEAAFKFALQYHKQVNPGQPRHKFIGRHFSYHGTTLATLAAGGTTDRKVKFEPLPGNFLHVVPAYCYRCPFGLEYPSCGVACARHLDYTINAEGEDTIAAVVMEPIQAGVGILVPPDEYLPMVQESCKQHGVLLIIDEVINGFGRTGRWFGHQHWEIKPDLMAAAKGITSAYLPLAATFAADHVFQAFLGEPGEMRQALQVNTYGGHPAACAAGLANLRIMEEERLPERAASMGAYLIDGCRQLLAHRIVGDVRGKGLLIGIELVKDKATREPFGQGPTGQLKAKLQEMGFIVGASTFAGRGLGNVLILCPPLVISKSECDALVAAMDRVFAEASRA